MISADVDEELKEDIDNHRQGEEPDRESRSQAVKRLLKAGMRAEESREGILITYPTFLSLLAWPFVLAGLGNVTRSVGYISLAVILTAILYEYAKAQDVL